MLDKGIGPSGYHEKYYTDRDWRAYSDILSKIIRYSSPGPILDLGAGCGYLVEGARLWGMHATGVEGAIEAIELAKTRVPDIDIRHQRLSEPLPFISQSFQTVVLNQVIEHLEPSTVNHVLSEVLRVLRPGGMLLIKAPSAANKREALADPTHINMMSPSQLRSVLLNAGFAKINAFDSPLPLLGRNNLMYKVMIVFFKIFPSDRFSATANAIAFKSV